MLELGIGAGRAGGASPAVFNAANEAAVALFLADRIKFGEIPVVVAWALAAHVAEPTDSLDALWRADEAARRNVEFHGATLAAKP